MKQLPARLKLELQAAIMLICVRLQMQLIKFIQSC